MRNAWAQAALWSMVLWLAACGRPTPVSLPPEEIAQRAAQRMRNLGSFHFVIERSGAPAFLDEAQSISFRRAEGDFAAPDRARAVVRVIAPGLVTEIQMISTEDSYWETNLLTGEWQSLPPEMGFNPADLFDPQAGFQHILETDLQALDLAGVEELDALPGQPNYHLTGVLDGSRLYELSYGMIGPEAVAVQFWVAPESFEINRILISEANGEGGEATTWQIDFWNFNEAIEINPPGTPQ